MRHNQLAGGLASLARSIPQPKLELDLSDTRLPEHIELALYRIAQEGLQNVVKHAAATTARLRFTVDDDVARLEIVDDGVGFDTFENPVGSDEMGGYGVLSMAERAELVGGRLNIRSRSGAGTAVTATIPLSHPRVSGRAVSAPRSLVTSSRWLPSLADTTEVAMTGQIPLVDYLVLNDDGPHLVAQECTNCGARFFDRRNACANCFATEFSTVPVATQGTVRAFTIVTFAAPGIPVPFVASVVDCDGTQVRANLINVEPDPEHVRDGMKVRLATYPVGTDSAGTEAIGFGFEPAR